MLVEKHVLNAFYIEDIFVLASSRMGNKLLVKIRSNTIFAIIVIAIATILSRQCLSNRSHLIILSNSNSVK